jgi:MFS family permease
MVATVPGAGLGGARLAVTLTFLANGAGLGLWAGHIPALQARFGLDAGTLGLALLVVALGAVVMMPLTGWLSTRFGSSTCTRVAGIAFGLALGLPLLAAGPLTLGLSLLVLGAANGCLDVSMNTQASHVQRAYGRAIMSTFHACFSLGGLAGAGLAALLLGLVAAPQAHLVGGGIALALLAAVAGTRLLPTEEAAGSPGIMLPHGKAWRLGGVCALVMLVEGAMLDWTAVFLVRVHASAEALAALGYAAFSIAMVLGRLTGDRLVDRLGAARVLVLASALAVLGLAVTATGQAPAWALLGIAAAGFGLANAVPILFTAGASLPGIAPGIGLAMVSTFGYGGFLVGPPAIGLVAELAGLRTAFAGLALAAAVVGVAAARGLVSLAGAATPRRPV